MFTEAVATVEPAPVPARVARPAPSRGDDAQREARGRLIAASGKIRKAGGLYVVPSQSEGKSYAVDFEAEDPSCTCPDFELRGGKCKHLHAVEFHILQQELFHDAETGATVETTIAKSVRVTYRQDWPRYNAAQTTEQEHVATLLRDLCAGIQQPPAQRTGRPRLPLADVVYAAVLKVYGGMSGRRAQSDLRAANREGHVEKVASYNSLFRYTEDPALTPILKALVTESARPLATVERDFAVDSTGFGTCTFQRWFDVKHGREARKQRWLKLHIVTGVRTNVVTMAEVTDADANDCPEFVPLVKATAAAGFTISEVSGDKAYLSRANLAAVETMGARAFVPFKSNSTPDEKNSLWDRLFHYFAFNRADFLAHYHKRSNVESTMHMLKAKFGPSLRSKSETAQVNELLSKVVAHNLCVLVSAFHELKIEPKFYQRSAGGCLKTPSPASELGPAAGF